MNDKKDDALSFTDSTVHIKQKGITMETHSTATVKGNPLNMQDLTVETVKSTNQRTIAEITIEIIRHKSEIEKSFVEIGWLLIEAKEQLSGGHGHWLKWLSDSVDISERMAQRYMQVAKAYRNTSLMSDLGITKALTLLALPEDEREAFINQSHEVNGRQKKVSEMSTREIKNAICKKKGIEEKYDDSASLRSRTGDKHGEKRSDARQTPEISSESLEDFCFNLISAQKYLDSMLNFLKKEGNNSIIRDKFMGELDSIRIKIAQCIFWVSLRRGYHYGK